MADEKPQPDKDAPPKGAVEVDEKALDEAAGGFIWFSPGTSPISSTSPLTSTNPLTQKVAPAGVNPPDDGKL